jgi:hypothetical protein
MAGISFSYGDFGLFQIFTFGVGQEKRRTRGLLLSVSYDSSIRTVNEFSDCNDGEAAYEATRRRKNLREVLETRSMIQRVILAEYEKIADHDGALFRPIRSNVTRKLSVAVTAHAVYRARREALWSENQP